MEPRQSEMLAAKMEARAKALRALARHPFINSDGRECLNAAADLYAARADMMGAYGKRKSGR